jgi:general secretion pathway protein I
VPAGGGFTLIEVLVALAIVAIGMSAVLTALASSADTVNYLRDKTFAHRCQRAPGGGQGR